MLPFRLALGTACATWLLLFIGGAVNPMGASMACPDWYFVPTCNGEFFPAMVGGVLFEHGHRLWASWVGILTLVLGASVYRRRTLSARDRVHARLGAWLVVLVALQGTLGGITVKLNLHPLVSTLHLGTAMVFFALVVYLTVRLAPSHVLPRGPLGGADGPSRVARWALVVSGLVYAQILLGGAVRHLGAGLICGNDWVMCGPDDLWLRIPLAHLHMTHRAVGFALIPAVLTLAWQALRGPTPVHPWARFAAGGAAVVVFVQVGLGLYTVASVRSVPVVTLHTGFAGLLFAAVVVVFIVSGPERVRLARLFERSEVGGDA